VETLSLGVLGKLKLWQALLAIQNTDPRLQKLDYNTLIARAEAQHDKLEQLRLHLAKSVFGVPPTKVD
jgi:hypothetical protein